MAIADRRTALLAIVNDDVPTTQLGVIDNQDDEWLERFPGGISPLPRITDVSVFQVNAAHLVATLDDFDDDAFIAFCEAVRTWQRQSAFDFLICLPPDLVVAKFAQDFPEEAALLQAAAQRADLSLQQYLGADRPRKDEPRKEIR